MKITSSYAVEIKKANKIFRDTVRIYNDAVSYCIKVFENEWTTLELLSAGHERVNYANDLIHSTSTNIAKYKDFDISFHKLPSYLRLAVVSMALGYLSSYHSNLDNWEMPECTRVNKDDRHKGSKHPYGAGEHRISYG